MRATSRTPLVHPQCRADKQHMLTYYGIGLCCQFEYDDDEQRPPRLTVHDSVKPSRSPASNISPREQDGRI